MTLRRRQVVWGLLFISPWLIGITFFFLWNVLQAWWYSFNEFVIVPGEPFTLNFVGLANYYHIFREHGTFFVEMITSVGMMLVNVPLIIMFSLFMAIILNRAFFGRTAVRAIFFLPVVMATPAISATMEIVMGIMMGGVSSVPPDVMRAQEGFDAASIAFMLSGFGVPSVFIDYIVEAIAMLHDVIRQSGVQILIFLAALQSIPPSMYEVAQIEGATGYETFWKITVPMVSPLILTNVVYTIVDTFAQSEVIETAHTATFMHQNFGVGSAMTLSSSVLAMVVLVIVGLIISKRVFYYN
jgi:ABC-type sugar transport system permease subunit